MFFHILFAVAKGLLEMDGFVLRREQPAQKTDTSSCCSEQSPPSC